MRIILSTLAFLVSMASIAQIPNASFDNGTESSVDDWTLSSGSAGVYSQYTVKAHSGDSIVKPKSGSGMLVMKQSGGAAKVKLSTVFALNERRRAITGQFIYLPDGFSQRFRFSVTYVRNDSAGADTILYQESDFTTIDGEGNKYFNWLKLQVDIKKENFRKDGNPDSCYLTVWADGSRSTKGAVLLIDDLKFTSAVVPSGIQIPNLVSLDIYPTQTSDFLQVSCDQPIDDVRIFSTSGQVVWAESPKQSDLQVDVSSLPKGLYLIQLRVNGSDVTRRFLKSF